MEAVRPFPSVPQMEYRDHEEDSNHTFMIEQDFENEWGASDFQAMSLRPHASNEMGLLPEAASYRHAGLPRCMKTQERRCSIDAPLAWQTDWNGSNPLPYSLDIPHGGSSGSQWTRIDQDTSYSGGSTWSPGETSDSRSEADGFLNHQESRNRGLPRVSIDYAQLHMFSYPEDLRYSGTGCATVIPHDLQQYPDVEDTVEDVNMRREPHEIAASEPYSHEDAGQYVACDKSEHFGPEDEALGSSIEHNSRATSIQEDDDSAMGDSPEMDDDDDYHPRAERRGQGRRFSHRSGMLKNPAPTPRRPRQIKSPVSQAAKPTKIAKKTPKSVASSPSAIRNSNSLPCPHCSVFYPSDSALKKHILASHTRPFICTFHKYGCSSTVGSKNEWKRHINVQHMHLETWRCDVGPCANPSYGSKEHNYTSPSPSRQPECHESLYHDFDRKDLFTQHLKRMHSPPQSASRAEKSKFESSIEDIQKRCHRKLRDAPTNTICPYCSHHPVFESWEDRVEHVGKHLERSDFDRNLEREDVTLQEWLRREGYLVGKGSGWRLIDTGKKRKNRQERAVAEGDEDAEGEDEE